MREKCQADSFTQFSRVRLNGRLIFAIISAGGFLLPNPNICSGQETNATVRQSPYFDSSSRKDERRNTIEYKSTRATKTLSVQELEQHMFELINQDRTKAGVPALTQNPGLGKLARELADDMMKHDYFGHTTFSGLTTQQRAKHNDIACSIYENIGTQSGPDPTLQMVDELEKSFMSEPEGERNHRYILTLPMLSHVGVGIAKSKNSVIVVQDFAARDPDAKNDAAVENSEQ